MEFELIKTLVSGGSNIGLGLLIFIIWYFERRTNRSSEQVIANYEKLIGDYRQTQNSLDHERAQLIAVIKDNTEAMTSLREIIKSVSRK